MSSPVYLDFIGTVWSSLPQEDQARLGEMWEGFEQIFAAVYQKYVESSFNIAQQNMLAYSTERWLDYTFSAANFLNTPATYSSNQDLSLGINLSAHYLIVIGLDAAPPVTIDCRGITAENTKVREIVAKINLAFRGAVASTDATGSLLKLSSLTSGAASKVTVYPAPNAALDATEYLLGLDPLDLPRSYPEFPLRYQTPYPLLVSIPALQDFVRDESVSTLLQEGVDYEIQASNVVAFKVPPPATMWARTSLFNQENPWNNYGFLIKVYEENSQRYVNVIQGLWYAFWNGPTPANVQRALYLLLGLPTALEAATVTSVSPTAIVTTSAKGNVSTFTVPTNLKPIVTLGQQVALFDPLVSGIEVYDKVNSPGFVTTQITRIGIQRFLTAEATRGTGPHTDETRALTLLEEYLFLPQIAVDAFIYPDVNLGNVRGFLDAIKPINKTYVFQITTGDLQDSFGLEEAGQALYDLDLTENVDANETDIIGSADLLAYETTENSGLNLDPNGVLFQETLSIDVYSFGSLIDQISA